MNKNTVKKMVRMAELFEQIQECEGVIGIADVYDEHSKPKKKKIQFHLRVEALKEACDEVKIIPFMKDKDHYTMEAVGTIGDAEAIAIGDDELRRIFPNEVAEFEGGEQDV